MLQSLLPDKELDLPLSQAAVFLPVTEMVGKHDFRERRIDTQHHLFPDKPDIAARINCSHSSLTAAAAFLSKGAFSAGRLNSGSLFLGNGLLTCVTHFDSRSSTNLLYCSGLMVSTFLTVPATDSMIYLVSTTRRSLLSSKQWVTHVLKHNSE